MKLIILSCLLGHALLHSATAELKYECPEPEDIFPCYCEEEDGDPWVFCNHLSRPDQMYDGVKGLKGYRIYKLSFFMNWILDPIKSDAFKDLAIERIVFENSTLRLTGPHLQGLQSHLNSIQLRAIFNQTNPIIPLELDHLTQLREIMFEKNRVTALPNDWLKSVPDSLKSVYVEGNAIITLGDEVFSKIKHLLFLVLESNRIVMIKRSMFPSPANDLRTLSLSYNKIRYLPHDIFSDMPALRSLLLVGNRLQTLDEKVWSGIFPQLTKLDVLENQLKCDFDLKWITNSGLPILFWGQCEEPEKLQGKLLKKLKKEDFI